MTTRFANNLSSWAVENKFLSLWCILLVAKMALLPFLPITPDETYYFAWAQNLQLSYFDHPPFISWLMWLGKFFWHSPLTIRLPGVVMCHAISLIWYKILDHWRFTPNEKFIWLVASSLAPMSAIGGFLITPDIPFLFFWSLAILYFEKLSKDPRPANYSLLGYAIGLGLLSKFNMVIFPIVAIAYFAYKKDFSLLKSWKYCLTLFFATVIFSPVIIWNYQNGFSSFRFQAQHGLGAQHFDFSWPFELIGAQILLWNPLIFMFGALALYKNRKKLTSISFFALIPLLFFTLASFKGRPEANWPLASMPAWIAIAILYLRDFPKMKVWWNRSLSACFIFAVMVISHSISPWLPLSPAKDRTHAAREMLKDIAAVENVHPLFARSYQMASFFSYYRPEDKAVYKLRYMSRRDFYDYLPQSLPIEPNSWTVVSVSDGIPEELKGILTFVRQDVLPSGHVLRQLKRNDESRK